MTDRAVDQRLGPSTEHTAISLQPIGRIATPWTTPEACPRRPWFQPEPARITLHARYRSAAEGLDLGNRVYVLWWAHTAIRTALLRQPSTGAPAIGVLAGRGPDRPNPIGLTLAEILAIELPHLHVRGMDCVDGTALLDLKPVLPLDERSPQ